MTTKSEAKGRARFRTRFDHIEHVKLEIPRGPEHDVQERRVRPEFLDETDINKIMARYRKTGVLPESALSAAKRYGDFSQLPTFMEMQEKVIAAHDLFAALPAAVRKQFDNDPGQFIAASETVEGRELMKKLGLGKEILDPLSPDSSVPPAGQAGKGGTEPPETPRASKASGKAANEKES